MMTGTYPERCSLAMRAPLSHAFGLLAALAVAQMPLAKDYRDSNGHVVAFPLGDLSFADEIVSFEPGNPAGPAKDSNPRDVLAPPDYDKRAEKNYVTLGCRGALTLRFTDNALVDVAGPDLYVFEIGPDVEPTSLSLSTDGTHWVEVGRISGGRADVDIASFARDVDAFHFVRLQDLGTACRSRWPGADIDAVGAIGGGLVISLNSAVLFDVDRSELKPAAERELQDAAQKISAYAGARILIDGHTDSTGSTEHNQVLSENRAKVVRDYFVSKGSLRTVQIATHGYGETRPIASNDTAEGRECNRRVEIIAIPVDSGETGVRAAQ
jgi:outer membrane protein OmpA-like peptidoglycan-associated protein